MSAEWLRPEVPHRGLKLQKVPLPIEPSAVAHQTAVGANHPMARYDDGYRILAVATLRLDITAVFPARRTAQVIRIGPQPFQGSRGPVLLSEAQHTAAENNQQERSPHRSGVLNQSGYSGRAHQDKNCSGLSYWRRNNQNAAEPRRLAGNIRPITSQPQRSRTRAEAVRVAMQGGEQFACRHRPVVVWN